MNSLKNLMPWFAVVGRGWRDILDPTAALPTKDTVREATLASVWLPSDCPSSEMLVTKGVYGL